MRQRYYGCNLSGFWSRGEVLHHKMKRPTSCNCMANERTLRLWRLQTPRVCVCVCVCERETRAEGVLCVCVCGGACGLWLSFLLAFQATGGVLFQDDAQ